MNFLSTAEICRSVLLLLVSSISLEVGRGNGNNREVYDLLCNTTRTVSALLKISEDDYVDKSTLNDAVYGTNSRVQFSSAGTISFSGIASRSRTGRGPLCTYYRETQDRVRVTVTDGYFAESLLGALVCVCTPGKGGSGNLCGIDVSKYNAKTWSGGFSESFPRDLLKDVWEKVIKNCTDADIQDVEINVKKLKSTVEKVRSSLTEGKISDIDYFYLGEKEKWSSCDGVNGKNICTAYKANGRNREDVIIPWADKIYVAIKKLKFSQPAVTVTQSTAASTHGVANQAGRTEEHEKQAPQTGTVPHETNEQEENGNILTETTRISGSFNVPTKSRPKSSPKNTPLSEIPHIATNVNDDGSSLTKPLWLSMFALLN